MKTHTILLSIVVLLLSNMQSLSNPYGVDDILFDRKANKMFSSRDLKKYTANEFIAFLNQDFLYLKNKEFEDDPARSFTIIRFGALEKVCEVIRNHKDKEKIADFLMKKITSIEVITPPKKLSWNEIRIIHAGGNVGLLTGCILDIKGEKGFFYLFDKFNKSQDIPRMKILFLNSYIYIFDNSKNFAQKLEQRKAKVTNPEILKIITDYQAKKAADDLKKQKEEAEKKAKM